MRYPAHRQKVMEKLEDKSIALVYSGIPLRSNEDEYHEFNVNSQFFYLTGLTRHNMALVLAKSGSTEKQVLFIEEYDPTIERWTGKMPTIDDVKAVSGIEEVMYIRDLPAFIDRMMTRLLMKHAYFDTSRESDQDLPDYNLVKANEFAANHPAVRIEDLHQLIWPIRLTKDEEEIEDIRGAIAITQKGLCSLLDKLRPGKKEFQAQADFEYRCRYEGATQFAFPTISACGLNGCMMHYVDNNAELEDGKLLLLDLGAKYRNYCSDISRTYPVNGTYSPRQREYYELVLKANRAVVAAAKPGVTLRELDDLTCQILSEGLIKMGKISTPDEIRKYYMHSVSHSIGIDCHDINFGNEPLTAGWIISDEPGLYIDEEEIGIRIEDDLLITEDGCICLSEDIMRDPDEIEAYMRARQLQ